jgi:hypothetical protein
MTVGSRKKPSPSARPSEARERTANLGNSARPSAAVVGLVGALLGCASSSPASGGGTTGGCPRYVSNADLSTPTVSFETDVMIPIFQTSCAARGSTCHGDPGVVASARPFLGNPAGPPDAGTVASVVEGLVGVKSSEDPSMNLVTAGDPAKSFLMHKMDGDQCTLIAECMVPGSYRPNCGVFMPYQAASILDVGERDVVRRWIQQGARGN